MSLKKKIILIVALTFVFVSAVGVYAYTQLGGNSEVAKLSVETKNKGMKEEVAIEVKEEVIQVVPDTTIDESMLPTSAEDGEKTVKYKDKEVVIPKRKVAAVKDAEDGQKQKTGGETATVSSFENDGQYVGIDVSQWQGKINWSQVAASGVQFAMIRVGFRGYAAEGNIKEDAYFRQNINGAVANGIKVGIYFYSTARNEEEAIQEAAWTVDKIKSYAITYPVAYDFEEFGMHRTASISGEQATNNAIAFLNYVGSQGFGTMMYANKSDITSRFQKSRLPYKFWLAHYTSATNYTGKYDMWQRTSKGSVPGISGYVDMNIAYFGYGSVAKPRHTHDFENGTLIKKEDATCLKAGYKVMRCKECSESKEIEIPKLTTHKYGDWILDQAATETENGLKHRVCSICKHEDEVVIPKGTVDNTINTNSSNTSANTSSNETGNTNTSGNTSTNTSTNTNTNTNANTNTNTNTGNGANTNTNTNTSPNTNTNSSGGTNTNTSTNTSSGENTNTSTNTSTQDPPPADDKPETPGDNVGTGNSDGSGDENTENKDE